MLYKTTAPKGCLIMYFSHVSTTVPKGFKMISLNSLLVISESSIHSAYSWGVSTMFAQSFNHSIKCIPMRSHVQNGQTSFPFFRFIYYTVPSVCIRIWVRICYPLCFAFSCSLLSLLLLLCFGRENRVTHMPKNRIAKLFNLYFYTYLFWDILEPLPQAATLSQTRLVSCLSVSNFCLRFIQRDTHTHTRLHTRTVNSIWPKPSKQNVFFLALL